MGPIRAGLTIVPVVQREGAPVARSPRSTVNFYHAVWTFRNQKFRVGLNVTTTTKKKVVNFFLGRKVHPRRKSWLRVWEKGHRRTLVWGPRVVNPVLGLVWKLIISQLFFGSKSVSKLLRNFKPRKAPRETELTWVYKWQIGGAVWCSVSYRRTEIALDETVLMAVENVSTPG